MKEKIEDSPLKLGDKWFLVSYKWWEIWLQHTNYRMEEGVSFGPPPTEIDNTDLLDLSDHTRVRFGAQNEIDYTLLPKSVWEDLLSWYGGGPVIQREVVLIGIFNPTLTVDVFPIPITFEKANSGSEPQHKLYFSRQSTIKQILHRVCQRYYIPPHNSRLWLKFDDGNEIQHIVMDSEADLEKTLEEQQLTDASTMIVETKDHRGEWRSLPKRSASDSDDEDAETELREMQPFQNSTRSSYSSSSSFSSSSSSTSSWTTNRSWGGWGYQNTQGRPLAPGAVGFNNLGNTCFMNSALQCLSNTPELTEYFLTDRYVPEINRTNLLGMKGLVAESYANLLKDVWSGKYSVISPVDFKTTIGKFRPQFSGFNQQDSQELVSFLLDGLHEDLNRCLEKPPTESIESDGRPDLEVAEEAWRIYLLRHKSIIVDLFTGQLRNRMQCPNPACDRLSITFDPMMYLSVPLPQKNTRSIRVHLFGPDTTKPPTLYSISVQKNGTFAPVRQQLAELSGTPLEMLLLCDANSHRIWSTRDDHRSVYSVQDTDLTYAFTVPPMAGTAAEQAADPDSAAGEKGKAPLDPYYHLSLPAKPPKHVRFQLIHRKMVRYSDGYVARQFDLTPMLFSVPIAECTNAHVHRLVRAYLNARLLKEDAQISPEPRSSQVAHPDPGLDPHASPAQSEAPVEEELYLIHIGSYMGTVQELPFDEQPFSIRDWTRDCLTLDWTDRGMKSWDTAKLNAAIEHETVQQQRLAHSSRSDGIRLRDCIELYAAQEQLNEQNTWYCNKCQEHVQGYKQLTLWKVPRYLCVHLKRFQYTAHWRDRLDDLVDFPLEGLDLREFVQGPQRHDLPLYDLYGVSNHMGGLTGGHYTAYVRNPTNGQWYSCNDSSVHPVSDPSRIVSSDAYLLFYKSRGASDSLTLPSAT